jgi:hypothetical protein
MLLQQSHSSIRITQLWDEAYISNYELSFFRSIVSMREAKYDIAILKGRASH